MAQQGFQYELNAAVALENFDIVRKGFRPAGAGSDVPDLMIKKPGLRAEGEYGCELKISPSASGGSLVLKHNGLRWYFDEPKKTEDEKIFIKKIAETTGALESINKAWKGIKPYKFTTDGTKLREIGSLTNKEIYRKELAQFPDVRGITESSSIEGYYNTKRTYYINVGTHGFYLLGGRNPLNLKGVRRFKDVANTGWRARVQSKGGGNYQFTFEMTFGIIAGNKSAFNIAPVKSAKDVTINQASLETSIAALFEAQI